MPSKSERALWDNLILAIVLSHCLQLFQMGIEVEIFYVPATIPFFNGNAKCSDLLFILFQSSETRTNNFAGIRVSAFKNTGFDKRIEMGT